MFGTNFSIQKVVRAYATVSHGRLVDIFVTCNVKMYGVSEPKILSMPTLQSVMVGKLLGVVTCSGKMNGNSRPHFLYKIWCIPGSSCAFYFY